MDVLTQAEYARRRGCSKQYFGKMMRRGLPDLVGDSGDKRIDAQAADRWLDARHDPARTANGRSAMLGNGTAGAADGDAASAYTAARTEKAQLDAQLARMEVERRTGGLVSAEDVKRQLVSLTDERREEIAMQTAGSGPDSPSTAIFTTLPVTVSSHPGNLG